MKKYFLLSLFVSACASGQKFPVTDHCDGERFFHEGTTTDKSLWIIAKWMFTRPDTGIPDWIENTSKPELPKELPSGKTALTFVNHATFLAQTKNFNFLTDPVWSKRVSPVSFAGPKRVRNPGIAMEELPQIHFVVISHNHYDHMDVDAIEDLHKKFKPVFITGLGNTKYLDHIKDIKIIELDWWQSTEVQSASATAKITMIPAKHWSAEA